MASDPNVPTNPPGGPYFTQRLWSEEVAIALAESGEPITTGSRAMSSAMGGSSSSR